METLDFWLTWIWMILVLAFLWRVVKNQGDLAFVIGVIVTKIEKLGGKET